MPAACWMATRCQRSDNGVANSGARSLLGRSWVQNRVTYCWQRDAGLAVALAQGGLPARQRPQALHGIVCGRVHQSTADAECAGDFLLGVWVFISLRSRYRKRKMLWARGER